jgi:hypothetical protein
MEFHFTVFFDFNVYRLHWKRTLCNLGDRVTNVNAGQEIAETPQAPTS